MKISLHIPQDSDLDNIRRFLRNELAEARNIKSKQTRKSVIAGLTKLLANVNRGLSLFTDGEDISILNYSGI